MKESEWPNNGSYGFFVHLPESWVCCAVKELDEAWSWTEVIFWLLFVQSAIGFMDMRQNKKRAELKQYTPIEYISANVLTPKGKF